MRRQQTETHPDRRRESLRGLIVPHAGHKYSGRTCGAGFTAVKGKSFSRIILLGPSHRAFLRGAVLPAATHFETPLGVVPVDRDAVRSLIASGIPCSDDPHRDEHCLEILLPFLQVSLAEFQIVPLLIGSLPDADRARLADLIRELAGDGGLIIASSDFTHYGDDFSYAPDVGPDKQAGVRKIDEGAIDRIRAMDAAGLLEYRRASGATICGIVPIAVMLDALPGTSRVEFLDYSQSANVTEDTDHMVSYAALAVYADRG